MCVCLLTIFIYLFFLSFSLHWFLQEVLQHQDFTKFQPIKPRLLEVVDKMLSEDIAKLMAQIPIEESKAEAKPPVTGKNVFLQIFLYCLLDSSIGVLILHYTYPFQLKRVAWWVYCALCFYFISLKQLMKGTHSIFYQFFWTRDNELKHCQS